MIPSAKWAWEREGQRTGVGGWILVNESMDRNYFSCVVFLLH